MNNKKKEQAKIEADKELALKELELKAQQDQASTSLPTTPPPHNKDAKLPSFIDEKDEIDSYLLPFESYAIKLSALLTATVRAMDIYTRMSDTVANDYRQVEESMYIYTEDGYKKKFREVKPETEELPDQFVIRLKNYLAEWLNFLEAVLDTLVDLIVKEQLMALSTAVLKI